MASITDCVVEGLKYPFNDIKKLLTFGGLFALISVMSVYMSTISFDVFTTTIHAAEKLNTTASHIPMSQLPGADINMVIGLSVLSFIIGLFVLGYQYDVIKFAIDKKQDLPGLTDILGIFVKGIKYFIVILAYNIIPMLVFVGGLALSTEPAVILACVLISGLLFIIASFILIMAINNMVAHDSLKKAFDFREIIDNISNLGWGKYIGIILFTLIVYMVIMVAVGFILSFLTVIFAATINNQAFVISIVIAIIEGLFVDSYGAVFASRVCGLIYREAIK